MLEYGRALRESEGVRVLSSAELNLPPSKRGNIAAWVVALLRKEKVNFVQVSWMCPIRIAEQLRKEGIRVQVMTTSLFPERAIKKPSEVAKIREVHQAAVIAIRAAIREIESTRIDDRGYLRKGVHRLTSDDVRHLIDHVLLDRNCTAKNTIVACGAHGADPHECGSGPLRAGQPIVMDIFPQHNGHGYWGDLTRTVVRGVPSPALVKMYRAVKAAQKAALDKVKPRVHMCSVHSEVERVFKERGYETTLSEGVAEGFIHSTGHGVGLAIHEAPSVSNNKTVLRKGHVITIEPGLYYQALGGIRIEDTIVVTGDGWKYLFPCEKRFQV